jgi:hypothetical protein
MTLVIVILVALALIMAVGVFFWYSSRKPLYEPGMVRVGKNLRTTLNFWTH